MTDDPTQGPQEINEGREVAPATRAGAAADVGSRFVARLIDHILLGIVIFVIIVPFVIGAIFADIGGFGGMFGGFGAGPFTAGLVSAALTIGYFAFMESNSGQTVGKMLMGLKTEGPNGATPTLEEAVKRNAWYLLGIIPFLGGLAQLAAVIYIAVTIGNSADNRGWHDEFAGGTRVMRVK